MTIAPTLEKLKKLNEAELIAIYDNKAKNTVVGTSFYIDELRSREASSVNESVRRMTKWITLLTFLMTALTAVNVYLVYLTLMS